MDVWDEKMRVSYVRGFAPGSPSVSKLSSTRWGLVNCTGVVGANLLVENELSVLMLESFDLLRLSRLDLLPAGISVSGTSRPAHRFVASAGTSGVFIRTKNASAI